MADAPDTRPKARSVAVQFDPTPPTAPTPGPTPHPDHQLVRRLRPIKYISVAVLSPVYLAGGFTGLALSDHELVFLIIILPVLAAAFLIHLKLRQLPAHRRLLGLRPSLWTTLIISAYAAGFASMMFVNYATHQSNK